MAGEVRAVVQLEPQSRPPLAWARRASRMACSVNVSPTWMRVTRWRLRSSGRRTFQCAHSAADRRTSMPSALAPAPTRRSSRWIAQKTAAPATAPASDPSFSSTVAFSTRARGNRGRALPAAPARPRPVAVAFRMRASGLMISRWRQRGGGQRLDVVRDHVVAARQHRRAPARRASAPASRAGWRRDTRPRDRASADDVHDVALHQRRRRGSRAPRCCSCQQLVRTWSPAPGPRAGGAASARCEHRRSPASGSG